MFLAHSRAERGRLRYSSSSCECASCRKLFHLQSVLFYTMIHLVHMRNQAEDMTGISPFIIIKTDQFEKMTVYLDSFPCIKRGCAFSNAPSVTFYAITLTFRTLSIISRPLPRLLSHHYPHRSSYMHSCHGSYSSYHRY